MYSQIDSNKRKTWLLMIVFIVVVVAIGYLIDYTMEGGSLIFGFAIVFSLVTAIFGYYSGDKVALSTSGAVRIEQTDNPYLYRMVENLCIATGLPMPKVHIIQDSAINAFATGRDPEHASIAVTTGAIERLENEELEGVIAHELSHIKNYDIRLMTVVIVLVGLLAILSDIFLRGHLFSSRSDNNRAGGVLMIVGIVLIILSPVVAKLIQFAVSRRREFLADASAALITRYPEGLARALEKIKNDQPMAHASAATAHLYIANPFGSAKKSMANLFSTHPPVDDRIGALRGMIK